MMGMTRRSFIRLTAAGLALTAFPRVTACSNGKTEPVSPERDEAEESVGESASNAEPNDLAVDADSHVALLVPAGTICVSEYAGNSIALVDPKNFEVFDRVTVGPNPTMMAQMGGLLLLSNTGEGSMRIIPLDDASASTSVAVGNQPIGIAVDSAAGLVYVGDYHTAIVSAVDPLLASVVASYYLGEMGYRRRTDPPPCCRIVGGVGRRPVSLALSPDASILYVANYGTYDLARVDLASGTLLEDYDGVIGPRRAVVSPDGSEVYMAGVGGETSEWVYNLYVYDSDDGKRAREVEVGEAVSSVALSPDGARIYAIAHNDGTFAAFDTASWEKMGSCSLGEGVDSLAVSEDGALAFVGNNELGTLQAVDLERFEVVAFLDGLAAPKDVLVVKGY